MSRPKQSPFDRLVAAQEGAAQPPRLGCAERPCSSCPYRRDTPPGIWAEEEYAKLPSYDDNSSLRAFLCHHSDVGEREMVCKGWLAVHPDCNAVRLALFDGRLSPEQRDAGCDVELYGSGAEACEAGLSGVEKPSPAARQAMRKLGLRRAARAREERRPPLRQLLCRRCAKRCEEPGAVLCAECRPLVDPDRLALLEYREGEG